MTAYKQSLRFWTPDDDGDLKPYDGGGAYDPEVDVVMKPYHFGYIDQLKLDLGIVREDVEPRYFSPQ